ncbi:MAG TPA: four helix bundle protein [Kiritimatiellia bacterium]|nr:four helix bundle protein [Kiritimatiellia bacterium]
MKTFEDLPVWKAGRELVRRVYGFSRKISDPGFCEQIQRAAVSVPSNIAEGHERGSTPDLIHFLFIAKGSTGEVRSQLYNAEDLGYLAADEAQNLRQACLDISRQLSGWIQSMQTPNFRGGPRHHKEPDRAWDRFVEKAGLERQPDGRFIKVREAGVVYGKRKTGKRKTGKRKTEDMKME